MKKINNVRRQYNRLVADETLEDYSLRYAPKSFRKWSEFLIANTAIGSISFLALEAIGASIAINYGFSTAFYAILTASIIIFLTAIPISYHAAKYNIDLDLITRSAGFGYVGSTITSLIYASFSFIFFALEAAIMAQALEVFFGLPLALGYLFSSLIIIPLVFYGITLINKLQLWTQPIWIIMMILPFIAVLMKEPEAIQSFISFSGSVSGSSEFNLHYFGFSIGISLALIAQIGEQVDYLRFMPPLHKDNRIKWWSSMLIAGPGWIILGFLKQMGGILLAAVVLLSGMSIYEAKTPIQMYYVGYQYVFDNPELALAAATFFVIVSQIKINVTNAYAGSLAWSNFFSRVTHSHPGRVVWMIFNISIALLLMELGLFNALNQVLGLYSNVAIAWIGAITADLIINKPLGLSPKIIEFKRAYLFNINPVGVGSMGIASILSIISFMGFFGIFAQAYSSLIALVLALVLAPLIAYITKGNYYIARKNPLDLEKSTHYTCKVCENEYEKEDMAYCPLHEVTICSLCCSLDSLCHDSCKKQSEHSLRQRVGSLVETLFFNKISHKAGLRIFDFISITSLLLFAVAVMIWMVYSAEIDHLTSSALIHLERSFTIFFFIISILVSTLIWWVLLLQENRLLAEDELEEQNEVLQSSQLDLLFQKGQTEKQKDLLELALRVSKSSVWEWNLVNDEVSFSDQWKEMLGYANKELPVVLETWSSRVHPDDLEATLANVEQSIKDKVNNFEDIHRLQHKNGSWLWILARVKIHYDKNNNAIHLTGTHTDITNERELQHRYNQQAEIMNQVQDSVITTDLEGNIVSWNHGAQHMLGYRANEVIGKNMSIIHREEDIEQNKAYAHKLIKEGSFNVDAYLVAKSKKNVFASISLSLLKNEAGEAIGLIGISQDITQRREAEEELIRQKAILDHQAHHDALTDLPNRVLFNDRLSQAISKAKRNKKELALFFIDLDRFKQINDSLGHIIGDKVLKEVASRLKDSLREEDSLARLGGDEFTILMEDLNHGQDASLLAQKILTILSEPFYIDEHTLYISSSIGISLYPKDDTDMNKLLMYADAAMYKAKDEGRDNFQFYSTEMTSLAYEHVLMQASLRKAMENDEFIVYYQPQVNAKTSKLIGMEALIRWNHPELGLVLPGKFIPLAEETGLIVEIDRWVMKTTIKQFVDWYHIGLNPGVLALNLAMKQLHQKDFIQMLTQTLEQAHCKASWLELEVTEGQIMNNPEDAISILKKVSDLGIELAIDDFGTGYSSLSYLKRLPIDKLKIDKSFVRDLPHDEEDAGITKAVIALAKSLNLKVIAEGVETKEQKDFLVENGCATIQGYLYARPMPAREIEEILKNGFKN